MQSCKSADVLDSLLSLCLGCGSRLCWKLEHRCFLTFKHISQQHPLPVWKFERIMMCMRVVLRGREEVRARGQTKVYKTQIASLINLEPVIGAKVVALRRWRSGA